MVCADMARLVLYGRVQVVSAISRLARSIGPYEPYDVDPDRPPRLLGSDLSKTSVLCKETGPIISGPSVRNLNPKVSGTGSSRSDSSYAVSVGKYFLNLRIMMRIFLSSECDCHRWYGAIYCRLTADILRLLQVHIL